MLPDWQRSNWPRPGPSSAELSPDRRSAGGPSRRQVGRQRCIRLEVRPRCNMCSGWLTPLDFRRTRYSLVPRSAGLRAQLQPTPPVRSPYLLLNANCKAGSFVLRMVHSQQRAGSVLTARTISASTALMLLPAQINGLRSNSLTRLHWSAINSAARQTISHSRVSSTSGSPR